MKLSDKILSCRKKAGLSQEELAERIGVSRQAISKWETGEALPEIPKVMVLAKTFQVSTDWLLSDEADEEPKTDYASHANGSQSTWLDQLPGFAGKMFQRFGWLFGVYLAVIGAGITAMGAIAKYLNRKMYGPLLWDDEVFRQLITNSPVNIMATIFMLIGAVLIICGIIAVITLRKRSKTAQ